MARVLKVEYPRRRQHWRWPVKVRNRRWQTRRRSTLRPRTLALLMLLVFLITGNLLLRAWSPFRTIGAAPPAPPGAWMQSAYAEPFVDLGWPERQDSAAPSNEDAGAPLAELPTVHRGAVDADTVNRPQVQRGSASVSASFGFCHSGGGLNCVVDGDTFWLRGEKIRIADIDAPETHPPRCAAEAGKGAAATRRLQALLSAGPFALESVDRDTDRYGRKLRVVTRGGESLGGVLVSEGLARWYQGGRQPWC